jgi:hypothetical protein
MRRNHDFARLAVALAVLLGLSGLVATSQAGGDKNEKKKKFPGTYTSAQDPNLPSDFKYQGEYVGEIQGGAKLGAQVIALDKGNFQAVLLPGGLPGDGWNGKDKILLSGLLEDGKVNLTPATGNRKYLAQAPHEFSATSKFPPPGQKDYTGTIANGQLSGKTDDGQSFTLKKTVREGSTLGKKAPEGAIILFDGTNADNWTGGARVDNGILNTDGNNLYTKQKFNDYTVHLEFMEPFRPDARGQGRGNSGFYQINLYEIQILDSFGLDGKNNECSAVYSQVAPSLNMCLPPLQWQTYDIDFTNAKRNDEGKVVEKARVTVKLNGVVVHDNVAISPNPAGRPFSEEGTPGPFQLQGHGNPLQFKNIWVIEKK